MSMFQDYLVWNKLQATSLRNQFTHLGERNIDRVLPIKQFSGVKIPLHKWSRYTNQARAGRPREFRHH